MKCYSDEVLQQFYDGECTNEQHSEINQHLKNCVTCQNQLNSISTRSVEIKSLFNSLIPDDNKKVVIPNFITPIKPQRKGRKNIAWLVSAASIIGILLTVHFFLQSKDNPSITIYQSMESNIDANQPISEQEFTMQYIDESGNIINLDTNLF